MASKSTNTCRVCLTEGAEFRSIFVADEDCGIPIHISEMIMAFASVQINVGDGLPEIICSTCAQSTVKLYLFKLRCEESDKVLRNELDKDSFCEKLTGEEEKGVVEDKDCHNMEIKPELHLEDYTASLSVSEDVDNSYSVYEKSDGEFDCIEPLVNTSETEFKCSHCPKRFNKYNKLNRHVKTHMAVRAFKCNICNKAFTRNDLLLRHKIAHAMRMSEPKFKDESITQDSPVESIDEPIVIKTESLYSCNICNMMFFKKEELDAHVPEHNKIKGDKVCRVCSKRFKKQSHLNRHVKIHSQNKPHVCPTCKKGFVRSEQLNNHMNMHSGIKPHVCGICLKGFNQISNLKDHMRTHNGEKPFLCSTCGKGFNQLGNLRQHTIRHSGIKAHLCSTCGNGFASKGELSAHLRKHTGARPFVCPICSHGFTTSSSLTKHKRIHSGEKPYACDVCNMKFSRSGILARHKRTHTGEKPYVCKFCMKAFSQSNDLTSHLRIHTGEKPYICDVCGQAFRQSSALKTHKKTHIDRSSIIESKPVVGIMQAGFLT